MSGKSNPGDGDVILRLGGEELTLVPSLDACRAICKMATNSLTVAVARVGERLDFEFIVEVVALGCGATSPPLKKQVAEKVYREGVISVAADVVLYLRTVMNGGKRPDEDDAERALESLDRALSYVPDGLEEQAKALEPLRAALLERMAEAGIDPIDPLAESESLLESSTAS